MTKHIGPDFGDISEDQDPEAIAEQVERAYLRKTSGSMNFPDLRQRAQALVDLDNHGDTVAPDGAAVSAMLADAVALAAGVLAMSAEYDALHRIAVVATAVLESEAGCKSLAELAQAVKAADWGDWTEYYPDPEVTR